jgi:hypothetical protein
MRRVELVWPDDLVKRVDDARGDVSRTLFVRRLVERSLSTTEELLREAGVEIEYGKTYEDAEGNRTRAWSAKEVPRASRHAPTPPGSLPRSAMPPGVDRASAFRSAQRKKP